MMYYSNGDTYIGEFHDSKKSGKGIFFDNNANETYEV